MAVDKAINDYEKKQKEHIDILKPPKIYFVIGCLAMVICGICIALVLIFEKDALTILMCNIVCGILFVLGLVLVLYEINFKAEYKEGLIIYRNIFRITREYFCEDIECVYYKDNGGMQFVFKDGRKLNFARGEKYFAKELIRKENLKGTFKGAEKPIIKLYWNSFFKWPLWIYIVLMLYCTIETPKIWFITGFLLLISLGWELSYTTYDKEQKILTRRICGLPKRFDMKKCVAKLVYQNGYPMNIEIYVRKTRVGKVPVSSEYKNRAQLIHVLCRVYV